MVANVPPVKYQVQSDIALLFRRVIKPSAVSMVHSLEISFRFCEPIEIYQQMLPMQSEGISKCFKDLFQKLMSHLVNQ